MKWKLQERRTEAQTVLQMGTEMQAEGGQHMTDIENCLKEVGLFLFYDIIKELLWNFKTYPFRAYLALSCEKYNLFSVFETG